MDRYETLIQQLETINIITVKGQINKQARKMLDSHPNTVEAIIEATAFLYREADIVTRIRCMMHNIVEQPTCLQCGKALIPVKYKHSIGRFIQFCPTTKGRTCSAINPMVQAQQRATNVERYGTPSPLSNVSIRKAIQQTNIKRYGGTAPMHSDEVKRKAQETRSNRSADDRAREIESRASSCMQRYGAKTYAQSQVNPQVLSSILTYSYDPTWLRDQHITQRKTLTEIADFIGVTPTIISNRFKQFNIDVVPHHRTYNRSKGESEVLEFIQSCVGSSVEITTNTQSIIPPYELDIYLPDLNLAIEYNGIFFHSEGRGRTRNYHSDKLKMCKQKGIRLIQVWSNEWLQKPEIVKSRIASALGTLDRVYARKCTIVDVATAEERLFLDHNHMQGYVPSSSCYGLVHQGNLVALMSFTKSRYSKTHEWELLRYSTLCNTTVVGGASKLFNHFIRQHSPASIISYCNLRWGTGNMYQQLGFDFNGNSPPNYFYFDANGDTNALMSRVRFQKHKLPHILEHFDSNNTEWENMQAHGFDRIWDCGNGIYSWVGGQ